MRDAVDLLAIVSALIGVVLLAGVALVGRRWWLRRRGGTFDCSLRLPASHDPALPVDGGKGWVFGIGRYAADAVEWYRMFSFSLRPKLLLPRSGIEVMGQRTPVGQEELALLAGWVVLECRHAGRPVELGMSIDALTGFLSWLEAAPPGQHVNVA